MAAFAASATAFMAAIVVSQRSASELHGLAANVVSDASPGPVHVSAAGVIEIIDRRRLQLLEVRAALAEGQPAQLEAEPQLSAIEQEFSRTDVPLLFPGEASVRKKVVPALVEIDRVTAAVEQALRANDTAHAISLIDDDVPRAFDRASSALLKLGRFNRWWGHTAAARGEEIRRSATRLAYALGAGAFVVTGVLACLVIAGLTKLQRFDAERQKNQEERSREMELFAARVAHDIRSPLSAALITCEQFRRSEALPDNLRRQIDRLGSSLKHTSQLVDGLYAFARAGGAKRSDQGASLMDSVSYVVEDLAPRTVAAGVSLEVGQVPDCLVAASPGVVASVLQNLIGNALKYAGAGARVTIRARLDDKVHVEVEDTGPGIPLDAQARIFRPFTREGRTGEDGLGLGLATVKRLVEGHRGACGVRSSPGNGSVFWFDLPAIEAVGAPHRSVLPSQTAS